MPNAEAKVTPTLAVVRSTLKKAGLEPAKRDVSKMVRGYSTVAKAGFMLRHETEYRAKRHERTGKIVVDILLSSWHADPEMARAHVAQAKEALTAAGFTVTTQTEYTLVVA